MPRRPATGTAGLVFHVMNRGARRMTLFETPADYRAFLHCLRASKEKVPVRLLAYCLMPNHFHLVVSPVVDGHMSTFMRHLLGVHSLRWRAFRRNLGDGAVYQGRFRAFAVQGDSHFVAVCRYVERNALRAGLVRQAQDWPWSSLWQIANNVPIVSLDEWPIARPENWTEFVNADAGATELHEIREAATRNRPFGESNWVAGVVTATRSQRSLRNRGRPKTKKVSGAFS